MEPLLTLGVHAQGFALQYSSLRMLLNHGYLIFLEGFCCHVQINTSVTSLVTGKPQCGLQSIQVNFHEPESDF